MLDHWLADWKEGDMNLQGRLLSPDGPLRKNRRGSCIYVPEKKKNTSCQLDSSSNAQERHGDTRLDQDLILQHKPFPMPSSLL